MVSSLSFCVITVTLLAALLTADATAGCVDHNGKYVSWWFTLKLPGSYEIAYIDSDTKRASGIMELQEHALDDKEHPPALIRTLLSLSGSKERTPYFLYNDQPDNAQPSGSYGHTKGVVASSNSGGFWITHSTPNFPSSSGRSEFYFPESEITYGQTFLCISLDAADIDKVAGQFLYTKPYIYKNTFPEKLESGMKNLQSLFDGEWVKEAGTGDISLHVGGTTFRSLVKNSAWDDDIYGSLVAPTLRSDLIVETWIRGSKLGSYCRPKHKYEVVDVQEMTVADNTRGNTTWTEGQDHSKWALAADTSNQVCICDINRMTTQRRRGGGCLCFANKYLSSQLYNTITASATCRDD